MVSILSRCRHYLYEYRMSMTHCRRFTSSSKPRLLCANKAQFPPLSPNIPRIPRGNTVHHFQTKRALNYFSSNPKALTAIGKAISRAGMAAGGAIAATVTYYQTVLADWTESAKELSAEFLVWLENLEIPTFSHKEENVVTVATIDLSASQDISQVNEIESDSEVETPFVHASTSQDESFMALTRRLLEVRQILKEVGQGDDGLAKLPAIVVIGSQSSGKSSLLEALVGQEFLPKGSNMVTRRPIEITLIHTPQSTAEYAEFPMLKMNNIRDFRQVQKIIADLNASVTEEECVSNEPIDLKVYSPNVPDLTLIDLPGYIAIHNRHQPPELKKKIVEVCRQYIKAPNIILAVCSADVDLANSEALNESRLADPRGSRTLGVLTKVDLVEPSRTVALLQNDDYPLNLGYIGVICKPAEVGTPSLQMTKFQEVQNAEEKYFRQHYDAFAPVGKNLGINVLRRSLMVVLEEKMADSLADVCSEVRKQLEEASYEFKVQFSDRALSAESYLSQILDDVKLKCKNLSLEYNRSRLRSDIQNLLDQKVIEVCANVFWNDPRLVDMCNKSVWTEEEWRYWQQALRKAQAQFTMAGIGRIASEMVLKQLLSRVTTIVQTEPWQFHPDAQNKMLDLAVQTLNMRFRTSVEQVENTIKPYKYDIEISASEWKTSLEHAVVALQKEVNACRNRVDELKNQFGRRKLRAAMQFVETLEKEKQKQSENQEPTQSPFSNKLLAHAREALFLQSNIDKMGARLSILKPGYFTSSFCSAARALGKSDFSKVEREGSKMLSNMNNDAPKDRPTLPFCPEPFLFFLAEKVASTATLFIALEMLSEFFYQYPRELELELRSNKSVLEIESFARQNKDVERHLDVQKRKQALERAMHVLSSLQQWVERK